MDSESAEAARRAKQIRSSDAWPCTPITPTLTRTQCASHTEVVHVVGCGVEEIGEESSSSTSSKSRPANSRVTHYVAHRLTTDQICVCWLCGAAKYLHTYVTLSQITQITQ